MPRVALTPRQRVEGAMERDDREAMRWLSESGAGKAWVATLLDISPRAVQKQFKAGRLSREVALCIRMLERGELPMP